MVIFLPLHGGYDLQQPEGQHYSIIDHNSIRAITNYQNPQYAIITTYRAVVSQTDSQPCISASGMDICHTQKRICACPRRYPFGTKFLIDGIIWECQDRLAPKYDNRIDLLSYRRIKKRMPYVIISP